MVKAKTKEQVLADLTDTQRQELREIDERLQEVLEERRAGRQGNGVQSKTRPAPRAEKQIGSITFRYETVRCGKENCSRCPHGPYWYAYWKEGGRTRSRYIGRSLPAPALQSYEEKRRARLER
jgi:ribosomal protein L44E